MKLKKVHLKNFKRFSNLEITDIPESAKLVLLTGPNGSGKTSLFEAFNHWMKRNARNNWPSDKDYFFKREETEISFDNDNKDKFWNEDPLTFHNQTENMTQNRDLCKKVFYVRTAYRHSPDLTSNGLSKIEDVLENKQEVSFMIQSEARVLDNYKRIVGMSIEALYDEEKQDRTAGNIKDDLLGEVRQAMSMVFDDLMLEGVGNPLEDGTFRFTKGSAKNFHYKNLSGGEKAAFDILLDFIVKKQKFDDTIFCIDEPELHMHTRLQANLLKAMYELIPDNCQLWLSTHSIGMARKAEELNKSNPESVTFIDFHNQNFDGKVSLTPIRPNRVFWKNMFSTALDDLSELVVPECVIFCEGKRVGIESGKPSFDSTVYEKIFGDHYPNIEFVPLGGNYQVEKDGDVLGKLLAQMAPGLKSWKILDKDDRNQEEIEKLNENGIYVLSRRDLESFLWDDEVLRKLCEKHDKPDAFLEISKVKNTQLESLSSRNKPSDDIKAITGYLYIECKKQLQLTGCGNSSEAFAIDNLAPLLTPDMSVYKELSDSVLAPLQRNS